jgi:hypothetical protein
MFCERTANCSATVGTTKSAMSTIATMAVRKMMPMAALRDMPRRSNRSTTGSSR